MSAVKLSVVVVAYEMPRQLRRTLLSLSPRMQAGISAEEYEIIVVDNGSRRQPNRAGCERYGATIRWIDVERPTPSPAPAVNLGLSVAQAPLIGVFVDGARMASPGLLAQALKAARLSDRPVISTMSYHLGREPQYHAVERGYRESDDEALLDSVDWMRDGYRLFDISVPGADFSWFRPPFETNGLIMPRALWDELGGFDEGFASPGGGLVNLDTYKRARALPDVELVQLLGEATFHQFHGGISSNHPLQPRTEWREEYERLRGHPWSHDRSGKIISVGETTPQGVAAIEWQSGSGKVARRYIDLLKASLLNEPGLDAEAAFFLARTAADKRRPLDEAVGRDVRAHAPEFVARLEEDRAKGFYFKHDKRNIGFCYSMSGRERLDDLDFCVNTVIDDGIKGAFVECGVWRGGGAILMRGILAARGERRRVWVVDSFAGLPAHDEARDPADLTPAVHPELAVSRERVEDNFRRFGLLDNRVHFLEGWFKDTLPDAPIKRIAVLRLDGDLYESTKTALEALYDRVAVGGFVIVDDYAFFKGCREAVDEFRAERGIDDPLIEIDWVAVRWRKSQHRRRALR